MKEYLPKRMIFVLEYIDNSLKGLFFENEDYRNVLNDPDIVFLIIVQIIMGLKELKKYNYCHRDLKLENVLISSVTYEVKLIDFNVSKEVTGNEVDATIINEYGMVPKNNIMVNAQGKINILSSDELYQEDIFGLATIMYSLCTRKILDSTFLPHIELIGKDVIMFKEILKDIFIAKKQERIIDNIACTSWFRTIDDITDTSWYRDCHAKIEEELNQVKGENKENPYAALLKRKIEQQLSKDEFKYEFDD